MEGRTISLGGEWRLRRVALVAEDGAAVSQPTLSLDGWIRAEVPGTVLGALVENEVYRASDLYLRGQGMAARGAAAEGGPSRADAGDAPPDLAEGDAGVYTFWWVRDFDLEPPASGERYWLDLHGVAERAEVFLNGRPLEERLEGRYRRHSLDVTAHCRAGVNRVALRVEPPLPTSLSQLDAADSGVAPDRGTGLWRSVELRITGPVRLNDPRAVTYVLGAEGGLSDHATVMLGAEVHNAGDEEETATVVARLDGTSHVLEREIHLQPGERTQVALPDLNLRYPDLWWPRGLVPPDESEGRRGGSSEDASAERAPRQPDQALYGVDMTLNLHDVVSDHRRFMIGLREVAWEEESADGVPAQGDDSAEEEVAAPREGGWRVNGEVYAPRGLEWTATDLLGRGRLRTAERYRRDVTCLADAGVELLAVDGSGPPVDPAFYAACDVAGILVIHHFPALAGAESPEASAKSFLAGARDTVKVLRNHPSLILWSGGRDAAASWDGGGDVEHCLYCHLTGLDAEGDPCHFTGDTPCHPEGVLDGTRPFLPDGDTASRSWRPTPGLPGDSAEALAFLRDVPSVAVEVEATVELQDDAYWVRATVTHPGAPEVPAFGVAVSLLADGEGSETSGGAAGPLPARVSPQRFILEPGQSRQVTARCAVEAAGSRQPVVAVGGWNVRVAGS